MKKLLSILLIFFILVGCNMMDTPTKEVEEFLTKYQALSDDVLTDLELSAESENLSSTNKVTYMDVMKRGYQNLKYEVVNEQVNGDEATVTVKVTVYDLHKAMKESNDYLLDNSTEFETDGVYDQNKFREYELNEMLKTKYVVDYTIDFFLKKVDDEKETLTTSEEHIKQINAVYAKVPVSEQTFTCNASNAAIWEMIKDDTW